MNKLSQTRELQLAFFQSIGECLIRLQVLQQKNNPKESLNYRCLLSEIRGHWAGLEADYNKDGHQIFPLKYLSTKQNMLSASAVGITSFLIARERCLDEPNCMKNIIKDVVSAGMSVTPFSVDTNITILLRITTGILGMINTRPEPHLYILDKFKSRFFTDSMCPADYAMLQSINNLMQLMKQERGYEGSVNYSFLA